MNMNGLIRSKCNTCVVLSTHPDADTSFVDSVCSSRGPSYKISAVMSEDPNKLYGPR